MWAIGFINQILVEHHFVPGIRNTCDCQDKHLSAYEAGILVGVEIVAVKKKRKEKLIIELGWGWGSRFALKIKQVWWME